MKFLKLGFALFLFILTQIAYAQNCCCEVTCPKTKHWYVDLGLGWVINQHAKNGSVPTALPAFPDTFLVDDKQSTVLALIGLGYLWSYPNRLWLPYVSTGLEFDYLPSAKIAGLRENFSIPADTDPYQYRLIHYSLIAVGKLGIYRWGNWVPYVSLGLGSTWNRSYDYSEDAPSVSPGFGNKTQAEFTYNAGLGLDFNLNRDLQLSLGYRYDNFSNNSTGNGDTVASDTKQLSSRTHADTILLSLRYLFA
jgi:opacity protein-like surface antigen